MEVIKRIKHLVLRSVESGQSSINDLSVILLKKSDWNDYVQYKNSIGSSDYTEFGAPVKLSNSRGNSRVFFKISSSDRRLGIIGTAGRNTDAEKLGVDTWKFMKSSVGKLIETTGCNILVSGGAAWADHLAVNLFLNNKSSLGLTLHLPCEFKNGRFDDSKECGKTANYYHKMFSEKLGVDTLSQIAEAISSGCGYTVSDGFKERNTKIAQESNIILAFTYGNGKELKDGGTKDTFEKFTSKEIRGLAFHINLNDQKIYIY